MTDASNDFAALARKYWGMWDKSLRAPGAAAHADLGVPGMRELLEGWRAGLSGMPGLDGPLAQFQQQSRQWLGQLQQVAAQFVGRDHSAADVATAWREAFAGGHPFESLMQGMRGPGLENYLRWNEAAAPWLAGIRSEAMTVLGLPAFGFAREHQERLQALGRAQLRLQAAQDAYAGLLGGVSQDAFARFEARLAEREAPGLRITSVRALFDLWVDAAEDAWAQAALSLEYRRAFGELVNAQMELRAAAQAIGEQAAGSLGLPGRGELDSAHRKVAELERQLRRLQRAAGDVAPVAQPAQAVSSAKPVAKRATAARPTVGKARSGKSAPPPVAHQTGKATTKTATKTAAIARPAAAKSAAKPAMKKTPAAAKSAARKR